MNPEQVIAWLEAFSYPAVFALLLACGMGAPLSEDLIVLAGGVLASKGGALLPVMMGVSWLGVVGGDTLLYRIGRKLGPKALAHPRLGKVLTPSRVAWVKGHFDKRGVLTVFIARFLPGVRAPTFLIAGMGEVPMRRFLLADAAAAALLTPTLSYLGFRFGLVALEHVRTAGRALLIGVVAVVVAIVAARWFARWRRARALARQA